MNAIRLVLILGSLLPGSGYTDAVEIPSPYSDKRCFCYPSRVVPAVYYKDAQVFYKDEMVVI